MASPFAGRLEPVLLLVGQAFYVYYLVLRLRKGLPRLLALLPFIPLCHLVIWHAPTSIERIIWCVFLMWYLLFKILLLAWDKGFDAESLSSFSRFLFANLSVLHIPQDPQFSKPEKTESSEKANSASEETSESAEKIQQATGVELKTGAEGQKDTNFASWVWKMATSEEVSVMIVRSLVLFVISISLVQMIREAKDTMSVYVVDFLTGLLTYFFLSVFFDWTITIPAAIAGTKAQPLMDMPFLSESLGEFWGRRWNLVIINLGRVAVYEPMLEVLRRGKKKPSLLDRALATETVFLVSGLMHELAVFYAIRAKPSWVMTAFFLVNGVGTLAERSIIKSKHYAVLPRFLRWAYTFTFLYLTGHWFFCPPVRPVLLASIADPNSLLKLN